MISKECFVKTMERLEALDKKMDAVDSAFKELNHDFCGFYITDIFDITIDLLEEMFGDTETNWIGYFVWERNWLHNFKLGDITVYDKPIEINDWGDVYDFLISNIEDDDNG